MSEMTIAMTTDYLTCGECLREFPLQCITLFIQHKKLDCDDETEEQSRDPELQCNYCPQGFMTAWALLVHAQLTHNLKIILEKASRSLLNRVKFSHVDQSGYPNMPLEFSPLNHHFGSSLITHNATPQDKVFSSLQNKPNENIGTSLTPGKDKTIEQSSKITDPSNTKTDVQSIAENCQQPCKMDSSSVVSRNIMTRTRHVGKMANNVSPETNVVSNTNIPVCSNLQISPKQIPVCSNLQVSPEQIPVCSNLQISPDQIPVCSNLQISPNQIPVCSNLQISPEQKLGILPITQTSLFPQCSMAPLTMSSVSDHVASNSSIAILPAVLCRTSFKSQPEPAVKTSANTYVAILKLSPQAATARSLESSNQSSVLDPAIMLPNSVTVSPHPPLIASLSHSSSSNINSSAVCSNQMRQSIDQPITIVNSSVDSTIHPYRTADDRSPHGEEISNIAPGNYMEGVETENPSPECCESQGCGVTVIPGSHEDLQKCCNAVVPKKRKRHMEQKHTPFSWSSSRYARRKMLYRSLSSSVARSTTSQYVGKPSAATIYIDLEPDSLKSTSEGQEGRTFKVTQSASPGVRLLEASASPVKSFEKQVGQKKPHTLILKPGAVFSMPFTYTIPTSMTSPVTSSLSVSRGSVSFLDSIAQSGSSSTPALNQDQVAADGNQTSLTNPDIISYSSTVGDDRRDLEKMRRHPTSKPFPCEKCAMAFNQRIHLKKHMSKHTGIKPYKCEECNYSTVERSHLKVHIRIHTGEKPFKCTFCEYATAQNSTLKIHLKRHHGGKMFKCQACEKQFTQAEQLKGHKWEHGSKVVASPEQKAQEDVKPPGDQGSSPSQSSVLSRLSTSPSQNSSDGQGRNFPRVEVKTNQSTNQQAVSSDVD